MARNIKSRLTKLEQRLDFKRRADVIYVDNIANAVALTLAIEKGSDLGGKEVVLSPQLQAFHKTITNSEGGTHAMV
jgi:hypothetical protein